LTTIIKLSKSGPLTGTYQIDGNSLEQILEENVEIQQYLEHKDPGDDTECESIRYCLWFDPDRCCSFFADRVLICEGLSEKALIDYLIEERRIDFDNQSVFVLNAAGKFNIPRYMNLFGSFGIRHAAVFDLDASKPRQVEINELIENSKNDFTLGLHAFIEGDGDFEGFLGINKVDNRNMKPLNVMWHYKNKKIDDKVIGNLIDIVKTTVMDE
jgi:predicted ATP-dependent endonuclease of OLD family